MDAVYFFLLGIKYDNLLSWILVFTEFLQILLNVKTQNNNFDVSQIKQKKMEETGESSSQETKKNDLNRKLVCIEYPGLVKNEENMIKTLGGLNKLSEVIKTKT